MAIILVRDEESLSDQDKGGYDHMERKRDNQLVGVILILLGFYWACRSLGVIHFSIFFDGWWTFLIMIPCLLNFIQGKSRGTSLSGIILAGMLLLWKQDVIPGAYIPAIFLSMVFILIGISIVMSGPKSNTTQNIESTMGTSSSYQSIEYCGEVESDHRRNEYQWNKKSQQDQNYSTFETCPPSISAILVGKSVSCLSGVFRGTSIHSILGNVQLDLRQAVLEQDVYVNVNLILGGADIFLPENVKVICETQSILADVRDVRKYEMSHNPTQPAIHIVGTCILGGLELK